METMHPMDVIQQLHPSNSTDLLMTSIPPPDASLRFKHILEGPLPLGTKHVTWPTTTLAVCLHCAGQCTRGPALPATKYFDPQKNHFWIYGPFCTPECVFGYICEHNGSSKQIAVSHTVLRDYFGIHKVVISPPRAAHVRFGGTITDADFHGAFHDTKEVLEPPFVTFAHYVMAVHENDATMKPESLLPQSAGKLTGLRRPEVRATPFATKEETGNCPLLLEFLANYKEKKRKADEEPKKASGSLAKYIKNA